MKSEAKQYFEQEAGFSKGLANSVKLPSITFGLVVNLMVGFAKKRQKSNPLENLTKQDAYDLMRAGARVSHRLFEVHQWITFDHRGQILMDGGITCSLEYWERSRKSEDWEDGYTPFVGAISVTDPTRTVILDQKEAGRTYSHDELLGVVYYLTSNIVRLVNVEDVCFELWDNTPVPSLDELISKGLACPHGFSHKSIDGHNE